MIQMRSYSIEDDFFINVQARLLENHHSKGKKTKALVKPSKCQNLLALSKQKNLERELDDDFFSSYEEQEVVPRAQSKVAHKLTVP